LEYAIHSPPHTAATHPLALEAREGLSAQRIGKYEIIKEVARGTTGTVFLSHDPYYRRDVAIKVYHPTSPDDPLRHRVARQMFLSEAHLVGLLQHPHILPIYDAGEENGRCYIVTEFIYGARTLATYCREDNLLTPEAVVEIAYKCARALAYAHGRGVIHRDIKPSNLMLNVESELRVIDFGIALGPNGTGSGIEGIAGSPSYMSPEQVQSAELSNRSDLYSLGAVMYELLTGTRPFRGPNLAKLMHQIVYATPPPIHTLRDGVPEELEAVVMRALVKDPEQRYASGHEFAAALTRVHQKLRVEGDRLDRQEQFATLRRLPFFHDFSHAEIGEILRASDWEVHPDGTELVRQGEVEDRFYVAVDGRMAVYKDATLIGHLGAGDCFGEAACVAGARRQATIRATGPVTILRVSSTRLEQASPACQLHFNQVFLRSLVRRLQGFPSRD
jgi:serine/threonine protein kinase